MMTVRFMTLGLVLLATEETPSLRDDVRLSTLPKSGAGSLVRRCTEKCPENRVCVELEVHCLRAPCPPVKHCVKP